MKSDAVRGSVLPLLFLLGPSGAGKSTLARWVRDDLGFLDLETDRFPEGDGIDLERLRAEWNVYLDSGQAQPLADELRRRIVSFGMRGAILSFPSGLVLLPQHIELASHAGIQIATLYGTKSECLGAFLRRETETGRGLTKEHWECNNEFSFARFGDPDYAAYRLLAFQDGRFRERASLVADVAERTR